MHDMPILLTTQGSAAEGGRPLFRPYLGMFCIGFPEVSNSFMYLRIHPMDKPVFSYDY